MGECQRGEGNMYKKNNYVVITLGAVIYACEPEYPVFCKRAT